MTGDKKEYLHGHILFGQGEIRIHSDLNDERKMICIVHEALHAMVEQAGLEESESVIIALGFGVVNFMRNNPSFVMSVISSSP